MKNTRIVLIDTTHPGNIGAAARAMKTMGLENLYLVNPKHFPHGDATALASNADDILAKAKICHDIEQAIGDCQLIIGTSARTRTTPMPALTPSQCGKLINQQPHDRCAILFGQERTGLKNEDLQRCHYHLTIPSNPDYPSLNLAAAVQIISYELRINHHNDPVNSTTSQLANSSDVERFYDHLKQTLIDLKFLDPNSPRRVMPRLRRLFQRSQLEHEEIQVLRGMLTAINKQCHHDKK